MVGVIYSGLLKWVITCKCTFFVFPYSRKLLRGKYFTFLPYLHDQAVIDVKFHERKNYGLALTHKILTKKFQPCSIL